VVGDLPGAARLTAKPAPRCGMNRDAIRIFGGIQCRNRSVPLRDVAALVEDQWAFPAVPRRRWMTDAGIAKSNVRSKAMPRFGSHRTIIGGTWPYSRLEPDKRLGPMSANAPRKRI